MKRSINNKQKFRIPLIFFVATILFSAVLSVRAGLMPESQIDNSVDPKRRVNVPYLGVSSPVEYFEPAIFWFGQVTPTKNYADVRLWYFDDYMKITLHIIDRRLWFDESPSMATIEEWDAVSLFLKLNGAAGDAPDTSTYRLVSGLGGWQGSSSCLQG